MVYFGCTLSHNIWCIGSLITNLMISRDNDTLKVGEQVEKPFLDVPELWPPALPRKHPETQLTAFQLINPQLQPQFPWTQAELAWVAYWGIYMVFGVSDSQTKSDGVVGVSIEISRKACKVRQMFAAELEPQGRSPNRWCLWKAGKWSWGWYLKRVRVTSSIVYPPRKATVHVGSSSIK